MPAEFNGENKIIAFSKLYEDKIIITTVPQKEILKDMYGTIYIILGVIIIASILAAGIALYLGKRISNPIVMAMGILDTTSKLDLSDIEETNKIKALFNRKDEIDYIFRSTRVLRDEMRKIITAIDVTTKSVTENINSLTTATHETTQATNDMAKTVEELA
ncbi:hypothetical protein [Tissierella praeacuta]|uniref:hypothetical protein n=1 Tax=Tissierella praeacuta TaxID=43131 RepID=UPI0033407737